MGWLALDLHKRTGGALLQAIRIDVHAVTLAPIQEKDVLTKVRYPRWLIRFDSLPHQKIEQGPHSYQLNRPVPESALRGESTPGFEILPGESIGVGFLAEDDRH